MPAVAFKFDPAQPRDDKGRFVTLYHGTRGAHVASILKEGLRPGAAGLVWGTESQEDAQSFAEGLDYPEPNPDAAVIAIRAPKSAFFYEKPLTPGRKAVPGKRVARFPKAIPPEWITRVQKYADVLKWNPDQPRDKRGRFASQGFTATMAEFKAKYPEVAKNYPRDTYTEMGSIEAHTKDVGREWAKQISSEELAEISDRFGSDVENLMTAAITQHDIGKAEAIESGAGKERQHEHSIPILQKVLRTEGFSEKDVALATELLNHDLIGPLFRGYEGFKANEAKVVQAMKDKAAKVGMDVSDFVKLQLAFYQADASAYPYVTQFMRQEPSGKWTFSGNKKIAGIEALIRKFDPRQPRDEDGKWSKTEYDRQQEVRDRWLAVNGYVHGDFHWLNKVLRKEGFSKFDEDLKNKVRVMDRAMEPLPADTTLHRIMSARLTQGLEPGDIFEDQGFISTSRNPDMMANIEKDLGYTVLADLATLDIEAPKGTGHLDVNKVMGDHPNGHQYHHQEEVILPRGTRFEVVSVEDTPVELENITRKNRRLRLRVVS